MNPIWIGALIGAGGTLLGAFIGYLNTRQQLKHQAAQAQRTHNLEKLVELGRLIDESAAHYIKIIVHLQVAYISKSADIGEMVDKLPNQTAIKILTLIYAPELTEMNYGIARQSLSFGAAMGVFLYPGDGAETLSLDSLDEVYKKACEIRDAFGAMSVQVAELAKKQMAIEAGGSIGVNLKRFVLSLVVLIASITIYPPYLWGLERKSEMQMFFQYQVPTRHKTIPDFAPIKARGFLFGSNEKEIQVGWGWDSDQNKSIPSMEPLKRQISWEDLLLEYVLALCVACIVGVLTSARELKRGS